MGIEPTALCLGIGAASLSRRLPCSQIRNYGPRPVISPSWARFRHLPERVPSICFKCTLASPAVKPSDCAQAENPASDITCFGVTRFLSIFNRA